MNPSNLDIVESIFLQHHLYYNEKVSVETIKQQAAQFKQVSDAYQGRFVFELLQNAIDRAENRILTTIENIDGQNYLIVANDGDRFTYNCQYDYDNGGNKRSDFQSLCSIATSTKDSALYIGNKGVGFKSVFSVSQYAIVYTRGQIFPQDEIHDVDFKIYSQFNNENELRDNGLDKVKEKLLSVQKENKNWGIPGYYFPIRLDSLKRPEYVKCLFDQGFVTVISVPISEENYVSVLDKIKDIRKYHFHFITEKHKDKNITLIFNVNGVPVHITSTGHNPHLVSRTISQNISSLAKEIGLNVAKDSKVSLYFKDTNESDAMIYNFMPTEKNSPIRYVDINADFQTNVDRKNIVFSTNRTEKIGFYNYSLLKECLILYRECLLSTDLLSNNLFTPYHIIIENTQDDKIVQCYKDVFDYRHFDDFVCKVIGIRPLGNEYCNYQYFYRDFLLKLIRLFHPYSCGWRYYSDLVCKCGKAIRQSNVQFLPDIEGKSQNKIFLSASSDHITLPNQIRAEISNFRFDFWEYNYGLNGLEMLKKGLDVSELEQTDEIFRLYRQCRNDGFYNSEDTLTEDEQSSLLASICNLIASAKSNESYSCSTWRFIPVLKALGEGKDMSIRGRAGVALSSVFLKAKNGKYKPAQLLHKDDIEQSFLDNILSKAEDKDFNIDYLLCRLGVSFNKYLYADKRLYESIGDGLSFIPGIISERNPSNYYSDTLTYVRVFEKYKKPLHPIWVNENYSFLFQCISINKDLRAMQAGKYDNMTKEYSNCLKYHLSNMCSAATDNSILAKELLKFYQKQFDNLYQRGIILVKDKNRYKILQDDCDYIIVSNKWFLSCKNAPIPILCFISDQENLSNDLKHRYRQILIEYNDSDQDEPEKGLGVEEMVKNPDTIARLLCQISNCNLSDSTFEESDSNLTKVLNMFSSITIKERISITTYCYLENEKDWYETFDVPFYYDKKLKVLYVEVNDSEMERSKNIVSKAIAVTVFHNENLTHLIESTLFYNSYVDPKQVEEMAQRIQEPVSIDNDINVDSFGLNQVKDKKVIDIDWDLIPDYEVTNYALNEHNINKDNTPSQRTSGTSATKYNAITDEMVKAGKLGEMIVAKKIAQRFMEDFDESERICIITEINNFLIKEKYYPIPIESNQQFCDIRDVINALWYTRHTNYQSSPFDIITYQDGKVILIEVKSTSSNDSFRLSCRETKVASKFKDNYIVYRVSFQDHSLSIIGNPMKNLFILNENKSFTLTPAGFFIKVN